MSSKHLKYDGQIEKYLEENKSYTQIAKIINRVVAKVAFMRYICLFICLFALLQV